MSQCLLSPSDSNAAPKSTFHTENQVVPQQFEIVSLFLVYFIIFDIFEEIIYFMMKAKKSKKE